MQIKVGLPGGPFCDFCGSSEIVKDYDCEDYQIPVAIPGGKTVGLGSTGKWSACQICADLIDAGDSQGLADRAAEKFTEKYGIPMVSELRAFLQDLHGQFWKLRK
jgi:hypothetical protein